MTDTSVVLWTRARPRDGAETQVGWTIEHGDGRPVRSGTAVARAERDHTVHVEVDGLDPGTEYRYTFEHGNDRESGTTRTLPDQAERLRVVVMCCSRWGWPGFEQCDAIVDERPDLVLHLGDSIYEVGELPPSGVVTDPPWECHTLEDYRRRYRQHRTHPSLRRLHASAPMLVLWDDHEVADNAPEPGSARRRAAGQRAWSEWMPMRPANRSAPLDRTVRIRGLLDLAVVDARFTGRSPADTDGPASDTADGFLLLEHQWQRLDELAETSDAPWFVLANQVQVGPMVLGVRPAVAWPPWRALINPDQWDGYPEARARLYRDLRRASGRAVVLSGDLHSAWSRTLADDDGPVGHEFTSPSISGLTYAEAVRRLLPIPARALDAWLRGWNDGIDHLDVGNHGYLVCDVSPTEFAATFVHPGGRRHSVTLDA